MTLLYSPRRSGSGRAGRGSDAFGGGALRAGDLPGGGEEEFDGAALGEDAAAAPLPDEDYDAAAGGGFGGFGGGEGGLSAQFDSLLETAPDATQAQRGPTAALSGVSRGVAAYFGAAFGDAESQDKAFLFADLCTSNKCATLAAALVCARHLRMHRTDQTHCCRLRRSLGRTQRAQLFAQVLILVSNNCIKARAVQPRPAVSHLLHRRVLTRTPGPRFVLAGAAVCAVRQHRHHQGRLRAARCVSGCLHF